MSKTFGCLHLHQGVKVRRLFRDWGVRSHILVLIALLGVPIGLGLFTFSQARGTSYFSDDPQTCVNCHIMRDQFDAWRHSSHARVATCNDCHTPHDSPVSKWIVKGINGFNHSVAFTTGDFHQPIRINTMNAGVVQQSCVYCHQNVVHMIRTASSNEELSCVSCHSGVGHNTRN
jgi:cytochrome c nitrite reductase small subunit